MAIYNGTSGNDFYLGTIENDSIFGAGGSDTLRGGSGNDTINGGLDVDDVFGDEGDDLFIVSSGNFYDNFNGGIGVDTVDMSASSYTGLAIDFSAGTITGIVNTTITGIEIYRDGSGSNAIFSNGAGMQYFGNGGDDTMYGASGAETMDGGDGIDTLDLVTRGDFVYDINLATGVPATYSSFERFFNFENVITGSSNDTITGTDGANVITSNGGNDSIVAAGGNDSVLGGDGNDTMTGGAGNDTMRGGTGNDALLSTGAGVDAMYGDAGDDGLDLNSITDLTGWVVDGGDGTDTSDIFGGTVQLGTTLPFAGVEFIDTLDTLFRGTAGANSYDFRGITTIAYGDSYSMSLEAGDGNDTVWVTNTAYAGYHFVDGQNGNDSVVGGAGNDSLIGGAGNDTLAGNGAFNVLDGGADDDSLVGGTGFNEMYGGDGNDTYVVLTTSDFVYEFGTGTDTVRSEITFALSETVENLTLAGVAAIDGTGNALSNRIQGNDAANVLTGSAGGDDTIEGFGGDDTITGAGLVSADGGAGNDLVVDLVIGGGTIDGGADNDTLDLSAAGAFDGTINLDAASFVFNGTTYLNFENVQATDGTEVVVGSGAANAVAGMAGDDTLVGNAGDDTLSGGNGDDLVAGGVGGDDLAGNGGADTLIGGDGGDTYRVSDSLDLIVESGASGRDKVVASFTFTLDATLEDLQLAAGVSDIDGTGNAQDNTITGNETSNVIDGGAGADTMVGGDGADSYFVDQAGDVVVESNAENGQRDTVYAMLGYTLGTNVENLSLMGVAGINATGNGLANELVGNTGNNVLDGKAGTDTMTGGGGSDTYVVDADDLVNENGTGASDVDTVRASVDYTLVANIENLVLSGTAVEGTGNGLANDITGNGLGNLLDGGGGADTMRGGAGGDTYVVNAAGDSIIDSGTSAADIDSVLASVNWTLGLNLDNLTLTNSAANGTGNGLANVITGNAAANTLDGKAGADTMNGGLGNDTYIVDNVGDKVNETGSTLATEIDTVLASANTVLGAKVENLTLTGAALSGEGNSLANVLIGNASANTLYGQAGSDTLDGMAGNDTLEGGTGNDAYYVDSAGDVVRETSTIASEIDTVYTTVTRSLGLYQENLVLLGTVTSGTGNIHANRITGNASGNLLSGLDAADVLIGNGGNDTLIGGAGKDSLTGGAGSDYYRFDTALNATTNVDRVTDFIVADDSFQLKASVFVGVGAVGALAAGAFKTGSTNTAGDAGDRIIYNKTTGQLFFDADGTGAGTAILFATVTAGTALTATDFQII